MNEEMFCYGIECDVQFIRHEWLRHSKEDLCIFERYTDEQGKVSVVKYDELARRSDTKPERIALVAEGTRPNQPFITQASEQNISFLSSVRKWFMRSFGIRLTRNADFSVAFNAHSYETAMLEKLGAFLRKADTGIDRVEVESEPLDTERLGDAVRRNIERWLKEDKTSVTRDISIAGRRQALRRDPESGNVYTSRLRAVHSDSTPNGTALDLTNESEGTQRMAELWQTIFALPVQGWTLFIDEIDRSLHPELIRFLVEQWRQSPPPNSQLIFTTHNDNLLEDNLLRRDEVWFVSKSVTGASTLASEVQFKPVAGVTRQRAYLDGMYGGTPRIPGRRFYSASDNPPGDDK